MRKYIVAAATALTLAAPAVVPAVASASTWSVQNMVQRQFGTQLRNRGRLSGIRVLSVRVRCANDGGGYYSCYATAVESMQGLTAKYGIYINVTPGNAWHTVGQAQQIWVH
jgi:hypothetical protein